MRRPLWLWILALTIGAALPPARADAQIFTPTFLAPRSSADVGFYLSDGPGELAVEGIWRRPSGGYDLGFRVGVADTEPDLSILVGGELRSPLAAGTAPIDLALSAALQAVLGGRDAVGASLGLTLGHTFVPGGFTVTPYVHPRIALLAPLDDDGDSDLELLAAIGADFGVGRNLIVRLEIGLEDGGGPGLGLAWR